MEGLASTLLLRPLPLLTLAERKHLDPEFEWLKKLGGGLKPCFSYGDSYYCKCQFKFHLSSIFEEFERICIIDRNLSFNILL